MAPFPHYGDFTAFTPVVPELYWNVYSAEERIKALCLEWVKLTAFTDGMVDTINDQYDIVKQMQTDLPQLVNDDVIAEIERLIDEGEFKSYVDDAVTTVYNELVIPRQQSFETDIVNAQAAYETSITNRQNNFERDVSASQTSFEDRIDSEQEDFINEYNENVNEIQTAISLLQTRMDGFDSLPTGSTSADAELMDIRLGFNGVSYANAGTAVRTQVQNAIKDIVYDIPITLIDGYYTGNGVLNPPSETRMEKSTNKIPISGYKKLLIWLAFTNTTGERWCAATAFDESGTGLGRIDFGRLPASSLTCEWELPISQLPANTHSVAFSFRSYGDGTASVDGIPDVIEYMDNMSDTLEQIERFYQYEYTPTWTDGYQMPNGSFRGQSATGYEQYSNIIDITAYDSVNMTVVYETAHGFFMRIGAYDANGAFLQTQDLSRSGRDNYNISILDDFTLPANTAGIVISFRTYNELLSEKKISGMINNIKYVDSKIAQQVDQSNNIAIGMNPFRFKKFYDHTFIDKVDGVNVIIPSESQFNIETSRRLGFSVYELNTHATSDGVEFVLHGDKGKFGNAFEGIGGASISDVSVSSVTAAWIKENVRFKSIYPKYRVAPMTLDEALYACRNNGLVPLVNSNRKAAIDSANKIMGKDNYIAYNGNRSMTNAMIMRYRGYTTKEEILAECNTFGVPYMYCMSNPTYFTESQLKDIVYTLHDNGYLIACASCYLQEQTVQNLMKLGFDAFASGWHVNYSEGFTDIANVNGDISFDGFDTTGVVTDGVLNLSIGDTITIPMTDTEFLAAGFLDVNYTGTIGLTFGHMLDNKYVTSNGDTTNHFSTFFNQEIPTFTIRAITEVSISSINYKAGRC